jgi:hypothetical protein
MLKPLWQKLCNVFSPEPEEKTFLATVANVQKVQRGSTMGYLLMLDVDNLHHSVPSYILDLEPFREKSNIDFGEIKAGDVIRTSAIGSVIEYYVPVSILGMVKTCPAGTKPVNKGPIDLGYNRAAFPINPDSSAPGL